MVFDRHLLAVQDDPHRPAPLRRSRTQRRARGHRVAVVRPLDRFPLNGVRRHVSSKSSRLSGESWRSPAARYGTGSVLSFAESRMVKYYFGIASALLAPSALPLPSVL